MIDETSTVEPDPIESASSTKRVVLLGLLTLFTITAAAVLHVNQPEFILDRFVGISEFEYSLFDTTLYLSYLILDYYRTAGVSAKSLFCLVPLDRWSSIS
jgi:hypothetical protein